MQVMSMPAAGVAASIAGVAHLVAVVAVSRPTVASGVVGVLIRWSWIHVVAVGVAIAVSADHAPQLGWIAAPGALVISLLATARSGTHAAGAVLIGTSIAFRLALVTWVVCTAVAPDPLAVRLLLATVALILILILPSQLLDLWLREDVLCRDVPAGPTGGYPAARQRLVSVHVPCCAEPPQLVIETLNALARQRYPNFEVHVIDNNTADEALWRPVEAHCRRLGPRFHFHHVAQMTGAKAGALNFALAHTDPRAELIAVVDSDYQAEPDFLSRLAPMFADPRLGGVQTRHDYRDWTTSGYQRGCYWEYRVSYEGYFVTRDRYGAGVLTGTMCMIRREAMDRAGGWAAWCCTEDSELSIRILAAGFAIRYLPITLGRGTMPETFDGYRRQRRRWRIGPTHELRRHTRALLLSRDPARTRLSPTHKILVAHHGLRELVLSTGSAMLLLLSTALAVVLATGDASSPAGVGAGAVGLLAGAVASAGITWQTIRHAGGGPAAASLGLISDFALTPVGRAAGLAGLVSSNSHFERTNKFATLPTWADGVRGTVVSALLGLVATAGCVLLVAHGLPGLLLPIAGYLAVRSAGWFTPLAWALYARHERGHPSPQATTTGPTVTTAVSTLAAPAVTGPTVTGKSAATVTVPAPIRARRSVYVTAAEMGLRQAR
jgi:hypothetical protein